MGIIQNRERTIVLFLLILIIESSRCYGQESYAKMAEPRIFWGIHAGTGFPDGHNKLLGKPLVFGITIDFTGTKNSFAFNVDIIRHLKRNMAGSIYIKHADSTLNINRCDGFQLTLDYGRQHWNTRRFSFETIAGIGGGSYTYYNSSLNNTDESKLSFVFSPGVSFRYFIKEHIFFQLKVQYNIANYNWGDHISTDLRGNAFMIKLILAGK